MYFTVRLCKACTIRAVTTVMCVFYNPSLLVLALFQRGGLGVRVCVCVCLGMGVGVEEKYPGMRIFNDTPEIRLMLLTTIEVY